MDQDKVKQITTLNDTAREIMMFIAERRRNTVFTAFAGLRSDMKKRYGHEVDYEQFNKTFEHLEDLGAGKLDRSPRGVPIGFYWSVPVRHLGNLLREELKKASKKKIGRQPAAGASSQPDIGFHDRKKRRSTVIVLRPDGQAITYLLNEQELQELGLKSDITQLDQTPR